MKPIIVAGIGTDVGKTVVSAILTTLFDGDYWKPVQCGKDADSEVIKALIDPVRHQIHPSPYAFKMPASPHCASASEGVEIDPHDLTLPGTKRPLIIESVGGVLVPLNLSQLTIDLFATWDATWFVVSKHYLGSINHTLLTIEALKARNLHIAGFIFNGDPDPHSEAAILNITQLPLLARLLPEPHLTPQTIHRYARQWKSLS